MKQQRRYKEPQDTLWGKFLSGFMAVVFAMSTLTLIPIASAINGEPNEAQIQQQEELADQTSGKDEKAAEPAADEQKLEPVELLSIASVEDEDDADDAASADVTLKVKAQNATVTYNGNDVATELVVPAGKDVKFTVKAADGFTLGAAAVKLADAKGETTLTPNAGEYTVAADRVADGAAIVVTAEAVAGSANTDAAELSTPDPSTELGEKTANAESIITSIMSFFGGTSMLDARGWGNGNGNAGINPAEVGSYPVYVYTQIHLSSGVTGNSVLNGQATDLIKSLGVALNGNAADNKWYTLGTISNAMTSPGNATGRPGSDADKNRVIENLNSLNRYGDNTFPLDKVSGWGLHTSEAADGYSGSQVIGSSGQSTDGRNITVTWHLDGTATIVKYTWKDGDKVLDTRVGFTGTYTENSEVNEPEAPNGYEFDGWEQDIEGEDVVFNAKWKKNSFAYTVEYYVDGDRIEAQEGWPTGGEAEYGTTASVTPAATATIDEANYMLESTNHSVTIDADTSKNVIKVVYTKDSIGTTDPTQPDGVADKYQATIKYAAGANGSVTGTTIKVVTLMDGDAYVTEATITPGTEGVTVTPATGYEFDKWTDSDPEAAITAAGGETYTYTANFKGDFTAISATPYEGVFDGAYHTPTVNGTIEGDTVSFSADHRNVTNGSATVTIKVTRGAETYTIDSTVTITPRPVVVTANDASKIYGEADPTLTAAVRGIEGNTASGLVGNDTVAYTVSRATGEDAGEYDITATGDAVQGNYAVTYMPATFTITAAGGNVVTADNIAGADGLTKMYDGQAASVEAEAARSGSTLLYSTDGVNFTTQNPVFTNAGSYDVYVMATNPNYEDTPVVRTTVTITPAPVTVTVGNAAKTAGAVDPTFAATVTGLVNGESAGLISYTLTRIAGEDAGSYVITAAGDRVQGNYIVTYVPGTLVITAALVPPAALPAGPAAPAAVAALDTILDDGVPLATIDDDENALAAFEEIHCWTHWLMIFGALVTIVYGLAVLYRRRHGIRDMDDFEGDIMGGRKYDAAAEKNPAAGNAFQAM